MKTKTERVRITPEMLLSNKPVTIIPPPGEGRRIKWGKDGRFYAVDCFSLKLIVKTLKRWFSASIL